ncbi:MAG TPA: glycosyltransferase family 2 protein [Candidatus Ozemobacteraceae bacterium]
MTTSGQPLVSVIMNCYNSSAFLREAIDSVLAQTYRNWEIVFWDNQSTDESAAIVRSVRDPRVRYLYAPRHTRLGEARNLAVREARGEWIAFLDCDDLWTPDKLERQMALVDEEVRTRGVPPGFVYGRTTSFGPGIPETPYLEYPLDKPLPEGELLESLLEEGDHIAFSALLVWRRAYWEIGGIHPELSFSEDYFLLAGIAASHRARAVQTVCCRYRDHASNLTKSLVLESFTEAAFVIRSWMDRVPEKTRDRLMSSRLPKLETYAALWYFRRGAWRDGRRHLKRAGTLYYALRYFAKEAAFGMIRLMRACLGRPAH